MSTTETLTIVFTDMVGSTSLSSSLPVDVGDDVRREHFSALRKALLAHEGVEVKNLGDGVMAAFKSPSAAVACAIEMQQNVDLLHRRGGHRVGLRVGVSGGEVLNEDGDYFGDPVIEAARLCAQCDAGQILATDLVRVMAGRRSSHGFVALGERELKGLPEPVDVCEVTWTAARIVASVPLPDRLSQEAAGFVGRSEELQVLMEGYKGALEGERRVVLLAGEPGIGKTTLCRKIAQTAFEDGALVLYGRCDEDITVAYQPFAEALGHLVRHADDELIEQHVAQWGGSLLSLSPGLGARAAGLAPSRSGDAESDRLAVFSAVVHLLAEASKSHGILLVLDDLHWADRSSLQLLRHLAASTHLGRVLVVGTYRDSELTTGHPLADTVASIRREVSVERLLVGGLSDQEVQEMIERLAGHGLEGRSVELAHRVRRETDGNPFFTTEVLRHLSEVGLVYQDESGRWLPSEQLDLVGLPHSVRDVVGQRVDRLGDETRTALSFASVIGRDFDLGVLARVSEMNEDRLLDLIENAVRAGLLTESDVTVDRFSFAHALTQRTLYDDLGATRRSRIHRRIAELLEGSSGVSPAELASHFIASTKATDATKALTYARLAGDEAMAKYAPADATIWYLHAIDLCSQIDRDDALYCEILVALGSAQCRSGDPAFGSTLNTAADIARRLGRNDLLVAAALANSRGVARAGHVDRQRTELIEQALAALPETPSRERALLLATLSAELSYSDERERLDALVREVVETARDLDDPPTLMRAVSLVYHGHVVPHNVNERLADLSMALDAATSAEPVAALHLHNSRAIACLQAGDRSGFDHHVAQCADLAGRIDQPFDRWTATVLRCNQALVHGDLAEAERLANEAIAVGGEAVTEALTAYGVQLINIRRQQGRVAELEGYIGAMEESLANNPGLPVLHIVLARLLCDLGRFDEARATHAEAIALGQFPFPYDYAWLPGLSVLCPVLTSLDLRDAAIATYDNLLPWADQIGTVGVDCEPPTAYALGHLAAHLGWTETAEGHLLKALEIGERMSAPYWRLLARLELVKLHESTGDPRAADVLAAARSDADAHGFQHMLP